MCRALKGAHCDQPEYCDGIHSECPPDVSKPNGAPCNNMGPAFCFLGECNSHNSQCDKLWPGSKAAHDSCYDLNKSGIYLEK